LTFELSGTHVWKRVELENVFLSTSMLNCHSPEDFCVSLLDHDSGIAIFTNTLEGDSKAFNAFRTFEDSYSLSCLSYCSLRSSEFIRLFVNLNDSELSFIDDRKAMSVVEPSELALQIGIVLRTLLFNDELNNLTGATISDDLLHTVNGALVVISLFQES